MNKHDGCQVADGELSQETGVTLLSTAIFRIIFSDAEQHSVSNKDPSIQGLISTYNLLTI